MLRAKREPENPLEIYARAMLGVFRAHQTEFIVSRLDAARSVLRQLRNLINI